jgi:hypothetical protein
MKLQTGALLLTILGLLQVACVSEATSDDEEAETTAATVDVTKNLEPTANTIFSKPTKTVGGLDLPPPPPPTK